MARLFPSPLGSWRWVVVAGLAATVLLGLTGPASAHHIPGATYTGGEAFDESPDFTVTLTVSEDGSVTSFTAQSQSPGSPPGTTYTFPIFDNHRFGSCDEVTTGDFDEPRRVEGAGCPFSGLQTYPAWEAVTTASPEGSLECQIAKQHFKKAKKKLKKADTPSAEERAKKLLKKAKDELRDCGLQHSG